MTLCNRIGRGALVLALLAAGGACRAQALLENPQPGSYQSGIGLVSGWSCTGSTIGIVFDDTAPVRMGSGTARADTAAICGHSDTGFGLLINFNTLGPGLHRAQLQIDGRPQGGLVLFTVTVPAGEFATGLAREVTVPDFPVAGKEATLIWQQAGQNFGIRSVAAMLPAGSGARVAFTGFPDFTGAIAYTPAAGNGCTANLTVVNRSPYSVTFQPKFAVVAGGANRGLLAFGFAPFNGGGIGQATLPVVDPQTGQPLPCAGFTLDFDPVASLAFYL